MNLLARFTNWKSTFFGTGIGVIMASVTGFVMNQAGCNFEQVEWASVLSFVSSQLVGAMLTDNGKKV